MAKFQTAAWQVVVLRRKGDAKSMCLAQPLWLGDGDVLRGAPTYCQSF